MATTIESRDEQETGALTALSFEDVLELDAAKRKIVARRLGQQVIAERHPDTPAMAAAWDCGSFIEHELARDGEYERMHPHYVMRNLVHLGVAPDMFPIVIDEDLGRQMSMADLRREP